MIDSKKIIFYAVSNVHIRNLDLLYSKIFKKNNYKITLIFEKNLKLIDNLNFNNEYEVIDISNINLNDKLLKNNYKFAIFSTAQARKSPFILNYLCYKNNVPIIALQETNQAFLHNKEFNNYVLPIDLFLSISKFESEYLLDLNNKLNTTIIGWPFNYNHKKESNLKLYKKKKFLLCLNASRDINNFSLENLNIQIKLISELIKKVGEDNLYVKLHPAESKKYIKLLCKNFNKNIFLLTSSNLNIYNEYYETLICTGFTQSIIESILNKKNILIIKLEPKSYFIEKYNCIKSININSIPNFNFLEFNKHKINYDKLINDHIPLSNDASIQLIENKLSQNIKVHQSEFRDFEYYLWLRYISIIINKKFHSENFIDKNNYFYLDFIKFLDINNFNYKKFIQYLDNITSIIIKDLVISLIVFNLIKKNKINFNYNFAYLENYPLSKNKNLFIYFINLFYKNKIIIYDKKYHLKIIKQYNIGQSLFIQLKKYIKNIF